MLQVVLVAIVLASSRSEPFVPVGVTYDAWLTDDRAQTARELQAIRAEGFNTIGARVNWTDPPARLEALERLLDRAADEDLKVVVQVDTSTACPDRPEVRAAFVEIGRAHV